jgi:predicted permease
MIGGLAGLAVAVFGAPFLIHQMGSDLSAVTLDLSIDWRVLGFTAAASLGATFLFGLTPAMGLGRVAPNDAMKGQSRTVTGDGHLRIRDALVIAQIGLSFALIVAAGLFVRTFVTLTTTHLGFDPSNLLIVRVDVAPDSVAPENEVALAQRVADAVATVPGVSRASVSRITPMSDGNMTRGGVQLSRGPSLPLNERTASMNYLDQGWFQTYGIRVIAGRDIAASDTTGAEPVVVVNQAFARRFAGGQNVLGQRVNAGKLNALIVGVVTDSVYRTVRLGMVPTMYFPIAQGNFPASFFSVTAKLASPRALVERNIAEAIGKVAPGLAFTLRDYGDQLRATMIQERLVALMSGFFGALAMLLAALGLYGVTAYAVGRRRAEIAIRMALGANARSVVRLVLGRVTMLILAGTAIGVLLSLWAAGFVGAMLFGVDARDPMTLIAAAAILVSVGLLAGWLPARKASGLDPTTTLRG